MVTVSIYRKNNTFEILAKGHAGYAEKGEDIYCSAVSILLYTLIEAINEEDLLYPPHVVMQSGDVVVSFTAKEKSADRVAGAFYFAETGFALLAKNAPEYVQVFFNSRYPAKNK